jgi:dihydroorotase
MGRAARAALDHGSRVSLFEAGPIAGKRITAEACVHHLWYDDLSTPIPARDRNSRDQDGPIAARCGRARGGRRDRRRSRRTTRLTRSPRRSARLSEAPAGLPLSNTVADIAEQHREALYPLEKIVEKAAHNPAVLFGIEKRGSSAKGISQISRWIRRLDAR